MAASLSIAAQLLMFRESANLEVTISRSGNEYRVKVNSCGDEICSSSWSLSSRQEAINAVRKTFLQVEETAKEFGRVSPLWTQRSENMLKNLETQDRVTAT